MQKTIIFLLIIFIIANFVFVFNYNVHFCIAGDDKTNPELTLPNPLGDNNATNINVLIGRVINAVLGIVGSLALVMFIYGGLTWMTAAGNKEKIQKGKDILIWATIGLIIIFSAYAIVRFVLEDVLKGGT